MANEWLDKAKQAASSFAKTAHEVGVKANLDKIFKLFQHGQQKIEMLEERLKLHEKALEELGKSFPKWEEKKIEIPDETPVEVPTDAPVEAPVETPTEEPKEQAEDSKEESAKDEGAEDTSEEDKDNKKG